MQDSPNPSSDSKPTAFMDFKRTNYSAPNATSRPIVNNASVSQPDPMISSPLINPASTTAAPTPPAPVPAPAEPMVASSPNDVTNSYTPPPAGTNVVSSNVSEPIDTPSISEDDAKAAMNVDAQPAPVPIPTPTPVTPVVAQAPAPTQPVTASTNTATKENTVTPKKKSSLLMDFVIIVILLIIIAGLIYIIKFKSSSL